MAFELKTNNLSGIAVLTDTAGLMPTNDNFIQLYDYATQFCPELEPELYMTYGKGSILQFLQFTSNEKSYASDVIQHAEEARLNNVLKGVTVAGNVFTCLKPHLLRENDVIKISDGIKDSQATVTKITSPLIFEAKNDKAGTFGFAGAVTVMSDFSSRFPKGSDAFKIGKHWNPNFIKNYTHIMKETYKVAESDMAHCNWVMTPQGPRWFNHEIENTLNLFKNKVEMTVLFHERVEQGSETFLYNQGLGFEDARGQIGVIPQIEQRGNIANDYITTVQNLSDIALRVKKQGTNRELTYWCSHKQMAFFRELCAGVNANFLNGGNYGVFNNSKEMALALDFATIFVDGVTFHFTSWRILDDPTLLGADKISDVAVVGVGIPTGTKTMRDEAGNIQQRGRLSVMYRRQANVDRKMKVQYFGLGGTPIEEDIMKMNVTTECTNQVVGANGMFVNRHAGFYL